jgi:hypothetical protein
MSGWGTGLRPFERPGRRARFLPDRAGVAGGGRRSRAHGPRLPTRPRVAVRMGRRSGARGLVRGAGQVAVLAGARAGCPAPRVCAASGTRACVRVARGRGVRRTRRQRARGKPGPRGEPRPHRDLRDLLGWRSGRERRARGRVPTVQSVARRGARGRLAVSRLAGRPTAWIPSVAGAMAGGGRNRHVRLARAGVRGSRSP